MRRTAYTDPLSGAVFHGNPSRLRKLGMVEQTNNKASRSSATTTTSVPNTNTDSMSVQRASKVAFASAPVLRKNSNANANGDVEPEQDENEIQTKKAKMLLGKKPVAKQVVLLDVEDPDGVQVVERDPPCYRCKSLNLTCMGHPGRYSCTMCHKRHWSCSMMPPSTSVSTTSVSVSRQTKTSSSANTSSVLTKPTEGSKSGRAQHASTSTQPRVVKRARSPSTSHPNGSASGKRTRTGLRSFVKQPTTNGRSNLWKNSSNTEPIASTSRIAPAPFPLNTPSPSPPSSPLSQPQSPSQPTHSQFRPPSTLITSTSTVNPSTALINTRITELSSLVQNQQVALEKNSQLLEVVLKNMKVLLGDRFISGDDNGDVSALSGVVGGGAPVASGSGSGLVANPRMGANTRTGAPVIVTSQNGKGKGKEKDERPIPNGTASSHASTSDGSTNAKTDVNSSSSQHGEDEMVLASGKQKEKQKENEGQKDGIGGVSSVNGKEADKKEKEVNSDAISGKKDKDKERETNGGNGKECSTSATKTSARANAEVATNGIRIDSTSAISHQDSSIAPKQVAESQLQVEPAPVLQARVDESEREAAPLVPPAASEAESASVVPGAEAGAQELEDDILARASVLLEEAERARAKEVEDHGHHYEQDQEEQDQLEDEPGVLGHYELGVVGMDSVGMDMGIGMGMYMGDTWNGHAHSVGIDDSVSRPNGTHPQRQREFLDDYEVEVEVEEIVETEAEREERQSRERRQREQKRAMLSVAELMSKPSRPMKGRRESPDPDEEEDVDPDMDMDDVDTYGGFSNSVSRKRRERDREIERDAILGGIEANSNLLNEGGDHDPDQEDDPYMLQYIDEGD
ncbi:hypothetical protein VKT23_004535 [Stygiomarasmius scandens]|uniref:Zn(2)-C6 fungal-type domain-containing protein n=1 Tax=Marasmiellus scandens TaxID=2682957 RepID=A0ABR1JWA9_9AGAR